MTIPAGAAIEAIAFLVPFTSLQFDRNRFQIGRVENPEGYEGNAHLPGKLVVRRVVVTLSNSWPYTDEMMLRADILFAGVLLAGNPDGTQAVSPEHFQGVTGVGEKNAAVAGLVREHHFPAPTCSRGIGSRVEQTDSRGQFVIIGRCDARL